MKYYGGIDLGGTNTKIGLLDENGNLIFKTNIKTLAMEGLDNVIKRISNAFKEDVEKNAIAYEDVVAVGIGIPGPVINKSTVKTFSNLPWGEDVNAGIIFKKYLNKNVYLDNDVNMITLGEVFVGAAKGYKDVVALAIGTGIGAGVVISNNIVSGKTGAGGEVGHVKIKRNGLLCGCGQKGCLEAYASATGIEREAESRLRVRKDNLLYEVTKGRAVEAKDVFDCAKQNDKFSMDIIEDITDILAYGLSHVLNILDPEAIIIGGGVALAGDLLFTKINEKLKDYTLPVILEKLEIKPAILGNDSGIYGAAYLSKIEEENK